MSQKDIHIEKYDFDSFGKEQKPFVMVLTNVIQNLPPDRADEFAMWVYLESLPATWKPNKQHLMDRFNISAKTYERRMEWLNTVKLIEYRQVRNASGHFSKGQLFVLSGMEFNLQAESSGTVKIDGTAVNKKKSKVIHNLEDYRVAKIGDSVDTLKTRASKGLNENSPNSQFTEPPLNDAHINTTKKHIKAKEKTNREKPVSVFSCEETVKDHIEKVVANRKGQEPLDDDVLDQGVFYSYTTNEEKGFDSVNKRVNIFLKKVREGKWLIPQGWNGITSQSIAAKEEEHERAKLEQYAQDKEAMKNIKATLSQAGISALEEMKRKCGA